MKLVSKETLKEDYYKDNSYIFMKSKVFRELIPGSLVNFTQVSFPIGPTLAPYLFREKLSQFKEEVVVRSKGVLVSKNANFVKTVSAFRSFLFFKKLNLKSPHLLGIISTSKKNFLKSSRKRNNIEPLLNYENSFLKKVRKLK